MHKVVRYATALMLTWSIGACLSARDSSDDVRCDGPAQCARPLLCVGQHCRQAEPQCGDYIVGANEVCDDGNVVSADGCSADCQSDEICGNGVLDLVALEFCDDGDANGSYGHCMLGCQAIGPHCGDGNLDAGDEVCELGQLDACNACAPDCQSIVASSVCGDGEVCAENENCDDGIVTDCDTCVGVVPTIVVHTNANWAAYQDGIDGPWTRLSSDGDGYHFSVTDAAGRYGLVAVCADDPSGPWVEMHFNTVEEMGNDLWIGCAEASSSATQQITVDLMVTEAQTLVAMGFDRATVVSPESGPVLLDVRQGPASLFAATGTDLTENFLPTRYYVQRNVEVTGDASLTVDFSSVDAFDADEPVAMGWIGINADDQTTALFSMHFSGGGAPTLFATTHPSWSLSWLPLGHLVPGDMGSATLTSRTIDGLRNVGYYAWFERPAPGGIQRPTYFGAASAYAAPVSAPSDGFVPRTEWEAYDDPHYGPAQAYRFYCFGDATDPVLYVRLGAHWLGEATTYAFQTPDLTAMEGWQQGWTTRWAPNRYVVRPGAMISNVGLSQYYRASTPTADRAGYSLVLSQAMVEVLQ
ncbi:MAG: DUF4215 domain-containing protein [Myxococcota bacterium]